MKTRILALVAMLCCMTTLTARAGGHPVPIVDPVQAPVVALSGQAVTLKLVQGAVISGLVAKGWTPTVVSDHEVHGTLTRPDWRCEIDVTFDTSNYTIKYAASEHLDYNAEKGLIHRNYNHWITLLRQQIDAALLKSTT